MWRVWVDAWQQQCCDEPTEVGSTVDWECTVVSDREWWETTLGHDIAATITHHEQRHGLDEPGFSVTGRVLSIDATFCAWREIDRSLVPVPGTCLVEPRTAVTQWEPEGDARADRLTFLGYVVEVEPVSVSPVSVTVLRTGRPLLRRFRRRR